MPGFETRVAILKKKIYNDGIEIDEKIVEHLASKITNNVRELEGALISLLAQATLNRKAITLDMATQMIDKLVSKVDREVSINDIQKVVCSFFNLSSESLMSKTRKREIVQARQIAMYLSKSHTKASLASIGAQIGGKDHATVLHACKTVKDLIETDKHFRQYIVEIERRLKG